MKTNKGRKDILIGFNKMMGNPMKAIDGLTKQAEELRVKWCKLGEGGNSPKDKNPCLHHLALNNEYCKCGNPKMEESDYCKDCI